MKNLKAKKFLRNIILAGMCAILLGAGASITSAQTPTANAGPDLYLNSGQSAVLRGSGYDSGGSNLSYYWSCSGGSLSDNSVAQPTYTAPAVLQYNNQATYICTLSVSNSYWQSSSDSALIYVNYNTGSFTTGNLIVSKKVINLTSGNLNWQPSVSAKPSDILSFVITVQADGADARNVVIRDTLPQNLIYRGNLMVNANINYLGNPLDGINVGTLPAGEIYVIAYQAQVAPVQNIAYGTTILNNSATVTSSESGVKTASAQVMVNNSLVSGATYAPTGAGSSSFTDFLFLFLPVALIILGSWLYFSGRTRHFADWLKTKI